ncbi:MAG: hypothetical protein IPI52_16115 [Bacteroidetes bacterium]|nr:hypothetical protein [Bacteroidota bacterium]
MFYILVDYPGSNLRIAKCGLKKENNYLLYFTPNKWAWNTKRVKIIQHCIKRIFVIFPFESSPIKKLA